MAIANKDVDAAYKTLMQEINRVLFAVADWQQIQSHKHRAHRGRITFHEQRRHPKAVGLQASTLLTRKLWTAYNQAIEISKSSDGYRRSRTWLSLRKILRYIPTDQLSDVAAILDNPASHDSALKLAKLIENLLDADEKCNRFNRINNWKCGPTHRKASNGSKTNLNMFPLTSQSLIKAPLPTRLIP